MSDTRAHLADAEAELRVVEHRLATERLVGEPLNDLRAEHCRLTELVRFFRESTSAAEAHQPRSPT
ncbi:MAG: hypothetical protein AB7J30_12595 [Hyphomicrobium sp.]|uniref:hypothetical protein n=1 Tax=Hyphomicrobium sp. TaxID=82 RepID=UPI003D1194B1